MRFDLELVRKLLEAIEARGPAPDWHDLEVPGYAAAVVSEHVRLLAEGGLIQATDLSSKDGESWKPRRLLLEGHQVLRWMRTPHTWERLRSEAGSLASLGAAEAVRRFVAVVIE
jgi:hypothetical protein